MIITRGRVRLFPFTCGFVKVVSSWNDNTISRNILTVEFRTILLSHSWKTGQFVLHALLFKKKLDIHNDRIRSASLFKAIDLTALRQNCKQKETVLAAQFHL